MVIAVRRLLLTLHTNLTLKARPGRLRGAYRQNPGKNIHETSTTTQNGGINAETNSSHYSVNISSFITDKQTQRILHYS